jgi:hypothetical protein
VANRRKPNVGKRGALQRSARTTWLLAAAGLLIGCLDATQVEVELTTDVNCADRPETAISVGTLEQRESSPPVAVTTACDADTGRIGSIVILPHESKTGRVALEVVAGITKTAEECRRDNFVGGCIVARRTLNFVKHRGLRLPIELEAACVDVPCNATQTCRKGSCVSAEVDPDSCLTGDGCMVAAPGAGSSGGGAAGATGVAGSDGGASGSRDDGGTGQGGTSGESSAELGGQAGAGEQLSAGSGGAAGQASGGAAGQASAGAAGQSSAGAAGQSSAGAAGQASGGAAGQASGGAAGQASGGAAGQASAGAAGQSSGGAAGQSSGGAAGQSSGGTGGGGQLGPAVVGWDSKASSGLVSVIAPARSLPEQPGDILFAWVCIASELGSATPKDSTFWRTYTTAPGRTLLLSQVRCQAFTATATGGAEDQAFSIFPASSATIQRLEIAAAKPPPSTRAYASGFPTTSPTTAALAVSQDHSLLVYFLGVSGSTTLGAIPIGASGQATTMQQVTSAGLNPITSGIAVAFDEPAGTAPKVTYSPANSGVWSSAGVVISPSP